jgi:LmbE family N-acetylglucosaminyl deacetylase
MIAYDALRTIRALPFADLDELTGKGAALIIAPHQDDESLGCGGLIAEACARGREPCVCFVTDGSRSHPDSRTYSAVRLRDLREEEARAALRELGASDPQRLRFLRLPDSAAPHEGPRFEQAVREIVEIIRAWGCATILAPWRRDPHYDHLAAHKMASTAAQFAGVRHLSFPIWGWLLDPREQVEDDLQGRRLDIIRHLPAKRRAIAAHASQRGKIVDDVDGFRLPSGLLAACDQDFEVYLEP